MGPLLFVNWRTVNVRFTAMMWVVAFVLAIVILVNALPTPAPAAHRSGPLPKSSTVAQRQL